MKILSFFLLSSIAFGAPVLDLLDKKGNTLNAEVLSMTEKKVSVKRTKDQKKFEIPLSSLSEETVKMLKGMKDELPVALPDYELDFAVGKRRKKDGASSYMVNQTISGNITVKNASREIDSPEVKLNVIIIGEDQRDDELKKILTNQSFSVSPGRLGESEVELKEFVTRYDSDNKGTGNLGGHKYADYILLLTNANGEYLASKSLNIAYAKMLDGNQVLTKKLLQTSAETSFIGNLVFDGD